MAVRGSVEPLGKLILDGSIEIEMISRMSIVALAVISPRSASVNWAWNWVVPLANPSITATFVVVKKSARDSSSTDQTKAAQEFVPRPAIGVGTPNSSKKSPLPPPCA